MFFARRASTGEPTPIFDLDFTGDAAGVFTGHAARNVEFQRASATALYQDSASSIGATSAGTNEGRIQNFGTGRKGHLIEPAGTNILLYARALTTGSHAVDRHGWDFPVGQTYTSSGTSPRSGVTDAFRIELASGGNSYYANPFKTVGQVYTASLWRRTPSGTSTHQFLLGMVDGGGLFSTPDCALDSSTATTTWERRKATATVTGTGQVYVVPAVGTTWDGASTMTQDVYVDLVQLELNGFATSPIITSGAPVTRAGENLRVLNAATVDSMISSGRLGVWFSIVPIGNSSAYTGTLELWHHSANSLNSSCKINASTRAMTLDIYGGGTDPNTFATVLPTWSAGDLLDIWVEGGNGDRRAKARVNEGSTTSLGTYATSASFGTGTSTFTFLQNELANPFAAMLCRVRAYSSGQRPGWAA